MSIDNSRTLRASGLPLLIALASLMAPNAVAGVCSDAVQGVIAWDGKEDTRWEADNVASLCRAAEDSLEPTRCFRAIMSGKVNWGGGTLWNPRNALRLCQGSRDARQTVRCFIAGIARAEHWREAIDQCQSMESPTNVNTIATPVDDSGLAQGHSFGTRDVPFKMGGDLVYRTACSNCRALYCAPGDEIIGHGGACEFGSMARSFVERRFDGPCAGVGCWTAKVNCRGAQLQPLSVIESRSSIQASCLDVE